MRKILFLLTILGVWGMSCAHAQLVETIELDTLGKKTVVDFTFEGNKTTQERIMLREMTFSLGDKLLWANLQAGVEQSRNNLMNTRLFNSVDIELLMISNEEVIVMITVQERWYLYPVPILEIAQTNFNTWWETKELRWLNYGVAVAHNNFRGLNQRVSVVLRFGYTKRFSASYTLPNLNKKQTLGLTMSVGYFENEEIVYNTLDNTRQFYRNPEDKARRNVQYKAGLSYRENIFTRHYLELGLFQVSVADSVPILRTDYLPGGVQQTSFLRLVYAVDYDRRDYQRYPLQGFLLYGAIQQDGLGLINQEDLNLFTTTASYRHHYKLGKRTYAAYGFTGKVNWSTPPYYLTQALGYATIVRGYEFYVIDGTRFGLFQSNFKMALIDKKAISIPFIPSKKFSETFLALYGNIFFDAGIVYGADFESTNSLVNTPMYSIGIGLDMVTYYDKVVRMEGSLNALGEASLNFHFRQSF